MIKYKKIESTITAHATAERSPYSPEAGEHLQDSPFWQGREALRYVFHYSRLVSAIQCYVIFFF